MTEENTRVTIHLESPNLRKCRTGGSATGHGSVSFKTGDEFVLEADMEARTCHLFVNSVQTKVFARGIPASVKLAVSLYYTNDGFEVKSFREVEKTKSTKLSDEIAIDF
ncbi:hypothetical protein BLNAU_11844 [Blattamonas nauphoetae]|uniref:Uncharacterized protein n=1 Tax=Blattamonas nauphoetae TaxID=2049346 RepID=A0ABQ9XLC3_9EUKA|nr:hypothetical protein BLNAU_11844 [Blattamonas nauphoetae]